MVEQPSPDTQNHTLSTHQFKQLELLWDIRTSDASEAGALAFMARCFIQATLPHSDPGTSTDIWFRRNGDYSLEVKSGRKFDEAQGKSVNIGIPYGSIPRLLFVWMTTEAIRTKSPRLLMGRSLSDFMDKIGITGGATGGRNGSITRLKGQMYRLLKAEFSMTQKLPNGGVREEDVKVSDYRLLFWNTKNPEQGTLWESEIHLTPKFFGILTHNPAPIDFRALSMLKQSSLGLDMYMWLAHRTFYLKKPQRLPWEALREQVGARYQDMKVFRHHVRRTVDKIKSFWPDLKADFSGSDIITLYPSPPLIPPSKFLKD